MKSILPCMSSSRACFVLMVARCTKIINRNTEDAKYVINVKQTAKVPTTVVAKMSHTFINGFWYLDQLGMTSTFNHKVYCRQALIGGNYAYLTTEPSFLIQIIMKI